MSSPKPPGDPRNVAVADTLVVPGTAAPPPPASGAVAAPTTRTSPGLEAGPGPTMSLDDLPRYVDEGEFARGGMAVVHRVFDLPLQRVVALKRLRREIEEDGDAVRRFVAEAQITGQLDHPNIVPVHEFGVDAEGRRYFAMKLVRGNTLWQAIHEGGELPWTSGRLDELLGVLLKVCDAVAFAHDRGVIHRDIKPENVLVGDFGQVYLMDWGLALLKGAPSDLAAEVREGAPRVTVSTVSEFRSIVGTPAYMAPEQVTGDSSRIDERTDVYALGAILYEMLTCAPPHQGDTMERVMLAAAAGEVAPPATLAPQAGLPRGLCRIAERALSPSRADRFASALEMKAALEQYLRGTDRFVTRTYAPGEKIVEEGNEGDCAFIITSGLAVAYKSAGGSRVTLRNLGPGDVFGEMAVLTRKPRTATVEAVDTVTAMLVTRESIREQLGGNSWLSAFVSALAERFGEVDARLTDLERQRAARPPR